MNQQSTCRLVCTSAATLRSPTTSMGLQQDLNPLRKRYKKVDVSPTATLRTESDLLQENGREKVQERIEDIILVVDRTPHLETIIVISNPTLPPPLPPKKPQHKNPKTNPQQTKSSPFANVSKRKILATPSTSPTSKTKSPQNMLGTSPTPKGFARDSLT
ncbi:hypothetical protein KCU81_g9147, partial [Aureobasidium melanogenum]